MRRRCPCSCAAAPVAALSLHAALSWFDARRTAVLTCIATIDDFHAVSSARGSCCINAQTVRSAAGTRLSSGGVAQRACTTCGTRLHSLGCGCASLSQQARRTSLHADQCQVCRCADKGAHAAGCQAAEKLGPDGHLLALIAPNGLLVDGFEDAKPRCGVCGLAQEASRQAFVEASNACRGCRVWARVLNACAQVHPRLEPVAFAW